jgi:hypothetical protein
LGSVYESVTGRIAHLQFEKASASFTWKMFFIDKNRPHAFSGLVSLEENATWEENPHEHRKIHSVPPGL